MSRISFVFGLVLGSTLIGGAVSAQTFTAYDLATPAAGNDQYGATLGLQFTVNSPINVTSLGAFDAVNPLTGTAHTLNGTIITTIYDSLTQLPVAGLTASFSSTSPGTLVGGYLYKPVGGAAGIPLLPGNYVVAFTTVENTDPYGNSNFPSFTPPTYNEGGNVITINKTNYLYNEQSSSFYRGQDKYPINSFTGQLDSATFTFTANAANTPEPGAVSLFGGLVVMGGGTLLRRRRLRKKSAWNVITASIA
ncbi:MAG: hypothetical protein JWL77_6141 [Chthonomonadaceae bacterium]|nr:hypothetical protein [Chthonomonadaceae bacterium]